MYAVRGLQSREYTQGNDYGFFPSTLRASQCHSHGLKAWSTEPSDPWRQRTVPQVADEGFRSGQTGHFVLGAGSYTFPFTQFVLCHLEARAYLAIFGGFLRH